jgi:DDE superfamily endonuclease
MHFTIGLMAWLVTSGEFSRVKTPITRQTPRKPRLTVPAATLLSSRHAWETRKPILPYPQSAHYSRPREKQFPIMKVRIFLVAHPNVRLHYTPTYSSWLNQVELWFSKIERDVIARGVFTSVTDLRRKLMRYIKQYNKTAKPVRWAYADPTRRIA